MIETLTNLTVGLLDSVLGWILYLPRDLELLVVAVMTSAALTLTRKWVTDQEWLARAAADQAQLTRMVKEARRAKDRDAIQRHKATVTLIKMQSMRFELKPLLWAIVPVALLATWAFSRLAFIPPKAGDPVEVRAYLPKSAIGQLIHVAPEDGLEAVDGWVQPVTADQPASADGWWDRVGARLGTFLGDKAPPLEGVAVWHIVSRDTNVHTLRLRYAGRNYGKSFQAGTRHYATPVEFYPDAPVRRIELDQHQLRLFDAIGAIGYGGFSLPPWLVGYLLITIPFVPLLKQVLRIY